MGKEGPALRRMHNQLKVWEAGRDRRAIFLGCYYLMTINMYQALAQKQFIDTPWVRRWLEHFSDFYFAALSAYEKKAPNIPSPWKMAFDTAKDPNSFVLQLLLLGINAHINFDLILALSNMIGGEWSILSRNKKEARYRDFCMVNQIISSTIDIVEDQVIKPYIPMYGIADDLLGPINEWVTQGFITSWRDRVWRLAVHYAETPDQLDRQRQVRYFEESSSDQAKLFLLSDYTSRFIDLR